MFRKVLAAAFFSTAIVIPLSASAQGVPAGVDRGAREGERAAGPVGAIVGGTIGGVVGGVGGILGVDERPRFRHYVVEEHRPSYRYEGDVRVGAVLPVLQEIVVILRPVLRCVHELLVLRVRHWVAVDMKALDVEGVTVFSPRRILPGILYVHADLVAALDLDAPRLEIEFCGGNGHHTSGRV